MAVVFTYEPPAIDAGLIVHAAAKAAETAGAHALLAASQPLVPYDTGELQASGHVEHDAEGAAVIYSAVAEDGYNYAAIQHEREDFRHEHGQAHYLMDPMHTAHEAVLAAMLAALRF